MSIIADTHVHLYPCYDGAAALRTLSANLGRHGGDAAVRLACLAERSDCDVIAQWADGSAPAPPGWTLTAPEAGALRAEGPAGAVVYLVAGRQIVTAERIEVLGLAMPDRVEDGRPAADTVAAVQAAGGVPVLAWAPGKWFFARGRVVRRTIARHAPGSLLLGDTTLRPTVWPEPALMRAARKRGYGIVAGSDPLPFAGEEVRLGVYASVIDAPFDAERPLAAAREALRQGQRRVAGRRGSPRQVLQRLYRLRR